MPRLWSLRELQRACASALAPPRCALCSAAGQWLDEPWGLDLCRECEAACPRWLPEALPFDAAFCLFHYEEPVDYMITRLKFHGDLVFARILGTLFANAWRATGCDRPDCIVPLPLHASRYRERGFCQTTELARHMARRLPAPGGARLDVHCNLLRRVRATRAQSGLAAHERALNLRNAFAVRAQAQVPRHVALLDDVLTTGQTALAAATALRGAGVERVDLWCCARA